MTIGRKLVGGSDIGGTKETQEMLDFCAKHNITADVELIRMEDVNAAYERLAKSMLGIGFWSKWELFVWVGSASAYSHPDTRLKWNCLILPNMKLKL